MSSPSPRGHSERKLAFLDTNTLHYVDLYLQRAKRDKMYPYVELDENDSDHVCQVNRALQQLDRCMPKKEDKRLLEGYQRGVRALAFLRLREARVQYSPVSELELSMTRTQGSALVAAAKERIPGRIWSKLVTSEEQIKLWVKSHELHEIRRGIEEMVERLREVHIEVTESSERTREIWDVARGITGLLYLSVEDCIIFASALVASAEYLLTVDGYLKTIVNTVHNPENRDDIDVQENLRLLVSDSTRLDPDTVIFPSAPHYFRKGRWRLLGTGQGR